MRRHRHRAALVAGVLVFLSARSAAGDDTFLHLKTPSSVQTDGGSSLRLPPGYFLAEPEMSALDAEMKRLQERETRLAAENDSLRKSAREFSFGWKTLSLVAVAAFGAGALLAK